MAGSIHETRKCWINLNKIRVWPVVGGSSSYSRLEDKQAVDEFYGKVRSAFRKIGYDGLFDVEALEANGKYT